MFELYGILQTEATQKLGGRASGEEFMSGIKLRLVKLEGHSTSPCMTHRTSQSTNTKDKYICTFQSEVKL